MPAEGTTGIQASAVTGGSAALGGGAEKTIADMITERDDQLNQLDQLHGTCFDIV